MYMKLQEKKGDDGKNKEQRKKGKKEKK